MADRRCGGIPDDFQDQRCHPGAPRLTGVELQSAACEEKTRSITRRELIGEWVRSRCPFGAWQLRGALFVESIRRLASGSEVQRAGELLWQKLPQRLASMESPGDDETPGSQKKPAGPPGNGHLVEIAMHAFDGSVCIDGDYARDVTGDASCSAAMISCSHLAAGSCRQQLTWEICGARSYRNLDPMPTDQQIARRLWLQFN